MEIRQSTGPLNAEECRQLASSASELARTPIGELASGAENFATGIESTVDYVSAALEDGVDEVLDELLWDLGWVVYELSWAFASRIRAQSDTTEERRLGDVVLRLANSVERLERPDRAPRAGGALRAHALVLSKRNTDRGYELADAQHAAADRWIDRIRRTARGDERLALACDELVVQFETAKAGTACRQVETFLCEPGRLKQGASARAVMRATAASARAAICAGILALQAFNRLPPAAGMHRRERLLLPQWPRQPANMAGRAHLLIVACLSELDAMNEPWAPYSSELWSLHADHFGAELAQPADFETEIGLHRASVAQFIEIAESAVVDAFGASPSIKETDVAETARVRLHLHVQFPSISAPTVDPRIPYAEAAEGRSADGANSFTLDPGSNSRIVLGLSSWLRKQKQDANVIGSAKHSAWLSGMLKLRTIDAAEAGMAVDTDLFDYDEWRQRYPELARATS